MEIVDIKFQNVILLKPTIYYDNRGLFLETFNAALCDILKLSPQQFIQDNMSRSKYGVLRGLHYQYNPPMGKLVQVVRGSGLDVVIDIRKDSSTYGSHAKFNLSDENFHLLWVPPGFAHSFLTLTVDTCLCYRTTAMYNKSGEGNINPFDSDLNIDWEIPIDQIILSPKDQNAQSFKQYTMSNIIC